MTDGERDDWVIDPPMLIKKATLTIVAMFFLAIGSAPIITHKKSTMYLYGIGRVMVAALLVGLEIEFAQMIIAEIHERAFNTSTSYPFPFLIF